MRGAIDGVYNTVRLVESSLDDPMKLPMRTRCQPAALRAAPAGFQTIIPSTLMAGGCCLSANLEGVASAWLDFAASRSIQLYLILQGRDQGWLRD